MQRASDELDLAVLDGVVRAGDVEQIRRGRRCDLGVRDGRIVALGDEVRSRRARRTVRLDGALVCAGFVDSHTHLAWAGEALWNAGCVGAREPAHLLAAVTRARRFVAREVWLLGGGWDRARLPDSVLPDRHALDAYCPDQPLLLRSADGLAAVCNSRALALMNLDGDAAPVPLDRDGSGRATGRLFGEAARSRATAGVVPPRDAWRRRAELRSALNLLAGKGITEVHDIATPHDEGPSPATYLERSFTDVADLQALADAGELPIRVGVRPSLHRVAGLAACTWLGEGLAWHGYKVFVGVGGYAAAPGLGGHTYRYPGRERAAAWLRAANAAGRPVSAHALGDLDVAEALDVFEHAPPGARNRLVHARTIHPDDVARIARLGAVVEAQPWDLAECAASLRGRVEDGALVYPWRTLLDAGVTVSFGSDWRDVEHDDLREADPLVGMQVAITRCPPGGEPWCPEQALDVAEALHAYTLAGATAAGAERSRGALRVGQDADLTVLSEDVVAGGAAALEKARVLMTVVAGRIRHDAVTDLPQVIDSTL